ncbi:SNF2-related protein [Rhizoctonia solani]|uniref:SNF2-related protein n=1 Tax=Rhizoctonia solani TaxID=456999 RepID=A0A0K6G887_9AGAM|nr:SNF2-related protein [Rhizoctonia solani]
MPLQPLAKIPLTFLTDVNVDLGPGPYDVLPWLNGPFRRFCGLRPVKGDGIDGGDDVDDESVDVAEGFILTDQAMQSLKEKDRKFFTPEARQKITDFCVEVRKHGEQLRQPVLDNNKKKRKRRGKKTSSAVHDDDSEEETFVDRVENIPGFGEFKGASLAMQNRAGGVIEETIKIMQEMDRTPMVAWRNHVYTSQVLHSRPARKLPEDELRKQRQEDIDSKKLSLKYKPPCIGKYLDDRLVTRVASSIFGAAAFMGSSDILWDCYRRATRSTIGRAWEREAREAKKTLKKVDKAKEEYRDALKDARDKPCPRRLHKASNCLKKWKDLAEITGEATEPNFPVVLKELEELWSELGFSSDSIEFEDTRTASVRQVGKKLRYALATPEQMQAAYTSYREQHFCDMNGAMNEMTEALINLQQEDSSSSPDPANPVAVDLLNGTGSGDLGVDEFAQTPTVELLRLMGIEKAGALPLTSACLKILWHQLVAIVIMLKRMFTLRLDDTPDPTLLCDDVGLGKTAQMLGIICMLVHCIELQRAGKQLPPLLTESRRLYFAGQEDIPCRPTVVVVPLGLIPQWYQQLKLFTTGAFQIIMYSDFEPTFFFEKGGPWEKYCIGDKAHRTIILVPISTIAAEAKKHLGELDKGAAGRDRAFRGEARKLGSDIPTLLNKSFLFFIGDEVHNFRNVGWAQLAAQQISANSLVRAGATATPVFTGSLDLLALGRLLQVLTMIGDAGYTLGMSMLKSQQTRRKDYSHQERYTSSSPQPDSDHSSDKTSNPQNEFLAQRIATANATRHRTFFIHREAIEMAKEELLPIIIRRTGKSRDPSGAKILDLEPYHESIAWSAQREHEMEAIRNLREALMNHENDGDAKEMQIIWKNFLLDHKKTLFHWLLATWKPEDPPFWLTWTAEALSENASSKIMTAIALTQHYQNPDAKPLFFSPDGTRDLVKEQECDCKPAKKPRKVIIFVMYTIHRRIMKKALSLVGIDSVDYDGRMTPEMRDEALKRFEANDNIRVLLMSNVGTTGLNLTMASVIIFLSGLWSGMETKQTIGRVWRAGQLLTVIIHHIFAPGTADVVLAGLAGDKVLMLDHLYEVKQISDKICGIHADKDDSDDEWQGEDKKQSSSHVVKSKVRARPRKTVLSADSPSDPAKTMVPPFESLQGVDEPGCETSSHTESDKAPARPRKRPLSVASENRDESKGNQPHGNGLLSQPQPTEAGVKPSKKPRILDDIIANSVSLQDQSLASAPQLSLASPANNHSSSPLPSGKVDEVSESRPKSPVLLPSSPHITTPSLVPPSSRGSSPIGMDPPVGTQGTISTANRPLFPDSMPNALTTESRTQLGPSSASSSQAKYLDPRYAQPPKQRPGQFKRRGESKRPAAVVGLRVANVRRMVSPPPTARHASGRILRDSSSPPPIYNGGRKEE